MPQMYPSNWMMLMIYYILIIMIYMSLIYFNYMNNIKNLYYKIKKKNYFYSILW